MANKELKYRAICPECSKPFDMKKGDLFWGRLICPDCTRRKLRYNQLNDYRNGR